MLLMGRSACVFSTFPLALVNQLCWFSSAIRDRAGVTVTAMASLIPILTIDLRLDADKDGPSR